MDAIVVFVTTSSEEEAAALAKLLVEQHLVACVNVLPKVKSFFQWEGNISEVEECMMILKTSMPLFNAVKKTILAQHSYDVPEIIALPIVQGSESYLSWIHDVTNKSKIS